MHEDRVRCQIELGKGQVGRFVIQYEIFVEGDGLLLRDLILLMMLSIEI